MYGETLHSNWSEHLPNARRSGNLIVALYE